MNSLFTSPVLWYLGKMTLISAILYGYYRAFLRNATFHPYNRWYLLGSVLLSLVLPLLHIPFLTSWIGGERYTGIFSAVAEGSGGAPDEMAPVTIQGSHSALFGWFSGWKGWFRGWRSLYVLYGVVCGVFAVLLFRSLYYLLRLPGRYASSRLEGVRFFQTGEPGSPFSFLNLLFWNKELSLDTEQGQFILRHELYHIRQKHTLDLLALESVRCLFWCNPFFHLLVREMKVIHEFLADRYALSAGRSAQSGGVGADAATGGSSPAESDRYAYAEWLVWRSVRGDAGRALLRRGVAHSFFNTHLKRRITMITQSNQGRPHYISRVMALPLFFLLFGIFAAKAPAGPLSPSGRVGAGKDSGFKSINSLVSFYLHRLRYPAAALQQGREETIWFSVRIGEHNQFQQFSQYDVAPDLKDRKNTYKITVTSLPARFPDSQGPLLTDQNRNAIFLQEARKASEKISSDTSRVFAPGEYFITVLFRIEKPAAAGSGLSLSIEHPQPAEGGQTTHRAIPGPGQGSDPAAGADTTQPASYPGGMDAWLAFLEKNSQYPLLAVSKNQQGTVVVQFRVDTDGSISQLKLIKDPAPGSGLGDEAMRVIKLSGKWEPAVKNGKPVVSYRKEPIVFKLDQSGDLDQKISREPN